MKIKITHPDPCRIKNVLYETGAEPELDNETAEKVIAAKLAVEVNSLKTGGETPPATEAEKAALKAAREAKIVEAVKKLMEGKGADFVPTCADIKTLAGVSGNVSGAEREAALAALAKQLAEPDKQE